MSVGFTGRSGREARGVRDLHCYSRMCTYRKVAADMTHNLAVICGQRRVLLGMLCEAAERIDPGACRLISLS